MPDRILVTGGAGFIGSNFILQQMQDDAVSILNFDKLTYAGNLRNLESVAATPRYEFVQGDIADRGHLQRSLAKHAPQAIVHFAAER
jgi:dTDP-glucose 4,6-dehydratase